MDNYTRLAYNAHPWNGITFRNIVTGDLVILTLCDSADDANNARTFKVKAKAN